MNNKLALALLAIGLGLTAPVLAKGYQRSRGERSASYSHPMPTQGWWGGHHGVPAAGSYFQRPYPYHLDYYRMRYGGSYAPYFGNQYGVPHVYAPAYGYQPFGNAFGWTAPQTPPGPPSAAE